MGSVIKIWFYILLVKTDINYLSANDHLRRQLSTPIQQFIYKSMLLIVAFLSHEMNTLKTKTMLDYEEMHEHQHEISNR